MRALVQTRYGGPEALDLRDMPRPEAKAGAIVVKVTACGANASDWERLTGRPAYARMPRLFSSGVRVPGSDVVGVVEAVGAGVEGFAPGMRVVADTFEYWGGFAEYCAAPAELWRPVPEGVSDVTAAALPQSGAIALDGMAGVGAGDAVLINGAGGGSGPLAVQLALAAGAEVTAVDNAGKAEALRSLGVQRVLDYREVDFAAEGRRYDLILDLFGSRRMGAVRRALTPGGAYRMVGGEMGAFWSAVAGMARGADRQGRRAGLMIARMGPTHLPELLRRAEAGELRPLIGEVAPLEESIGALTRMGAGEISGKLVIVP
ncbi:NAD(P)-dependent alcohol dehydrogenase [Pseudoroseicyclus tamaricis]|uniref:NAD(P)-dependent alcohol dehydrogenase n=1 Tax=Pseudoroseicyclus tamaricis TaxID=2705421 RepID=UPI003744152B